MTAGRPLHVALYTPAWPAGALPNGIVTYTAELSPALRARGHRVTILPAHCAPEDAGPEVERPVAPKPSLPVRLLERLRPAASARRHHERGILSALDRASASQPVDLLEMEETFGWCGGVAARSRVPVVARLHGPWFLNGPMVDDEASPAFQERVRIEGEALRRVAAITAPSADVLAQTRAFYGDGFPPSEVIFNPLGAPPDADRWRADAADPKEILFVGRFDGHKGGDVVVDAFARIHAEDPAARLVFVGPDRGVLRADGSRIGIDAYLGERLSSDARAAVRWLGPQSPEEIRRHRCHAALTLVASRYEILGYTLSEAMSQGCPIIATAVGGFVELIEDERSGLLVPSEAPEALAAAALRLLRDPARAAELGQAAHARYEAVLEPGAIAARTESFYRRVLDPAEASEGD